MSRVCVIAGTSGLFGWDAHARGHVDWWRPGSPWVQALEAAGHQLADTADPYSWTGDVDGLVARDVDWIEAGNALRWWWAAHGIGVRAIVAHSHGLQVLAYAQIAVPALITAGSPVRHDLLGRYAELRAKVGAWWHLYSDRDAWQILGELRDGGAWMGWRRTIPGASNVLVPGQSHSGLMRPDVWTALGAWAWCA